ncbi:MAG: phage holin family protein [Chloroflexi bacterium]|nr:phage holin family protein [Chloroflexota bacterium]
MRNIIIKIIVNMLALWAAAFFVGGISLTGNLLQWLVVAIVFGLVNAFIKPLVKLLTLPINVATLGLFSLVINTVLLLLTGLLANGLSFDGGPFANIWSAFLGSLVISIVSTILNWFLKD